MPDLTSSDVFSASIERSSRDLKDMTNKNRVIMKSLLKNEPLMVKPRYHSWHPHGGVGGEPYQAKYSIIDMPSSKTRPNLKIYTRLSKFYSK